MYRIPGLLSPAIMQSCQVEHLVRGPGAQSQVSDQSLNTQYTWHIQQYLFLMQSTLGELLAMPCKIACPLTSHPAYPAILVPEARRAISYARQNHTPT